MIKTAKELKRIADERNSLREEEVIKASDWCFDNVTKIFHDKIFSSADEGCYSASLDIKPYLEEAVKDIPHLRKDEVMRGIIKRIQKYCKRLGFAAKVYDDLYGQLMLQVWWN